MTVFTYKAVTSGGETVEGRLEALDKAGAVRRLKEQGYLPIRAEPVKAGLSLARAEIRLPFLSKGVTRKDVALITRELATLMGARLPLDRALQLMINLGTKGRMRSLLVDVLERIQRGGTLSDALAEHPAVIPGHYVSMVRAGEAGGSLDEVLAGVSDHLDKSEALRETVRSALIYLVILVLMVGVTLVVMLTLVLPKFQRMFEDADARLPFAAFVVMRSGELFREYGWWTLPSAALLLAMLVRWRLRRPEGQLAVDRFMLRLPLLGSLLARIETARFARTMASLLGNGVDVLGAMVIVRETLTNVAMRCAVEDVSRRLKRGDGLAAPLRATGLWPPLALHLIEVGEETGELPAMLKRTADIFETEVAAGASRLLALLTPVLTLVTGAIVAAVVGARSCQPSSASTACRSEGNASVSHSLPRPSSSSEKATNHGAYQQPSPRGAPPPRAARRAARRGLHPDRAAGGDRHPRHAGGDRGPTGGEAARRRQDRHGAHPDTRARHDPRRLPARDRRLPNNEPGAAGALRTAARAQAVERALREASRRAQRSLGQHVPVPAPRPARGIRPLVERGRQGGRNADGPALQLVGPDAGFTLIELLVVLVIMGLVLAVALPGRLSGSDAVELRSAARSIADGLERSRSRALLSGTETVFAVDVERRRFQVPGDPEPVALPAQASLALRTVRGDVADADSGGIRFFPDGGSTGGGVAISQHGQGYRITVSWLTGRVEVSDAP